MFSPPGFVSHFIYQPVLPKVEVFSKVFSGAAAAAPLSYIATFIASIMYGAAVNAILIPISTIKLIFSPPGFVSHYIYQPVLPNIEVFLNFFLTLFC